MKQFKFICVVSLASSVLLSSCGENEAPIQDEEIPAVADVSEVDEVNNEEEQSFDPNLSYEVPTPSDLFLALQSLGSEGKFDFLNNPSKVSNYGDKKSKALNFGVYFADLSYASSFNYGPELVKYIKVVDDLSDELNIKSALDKALTDRLQEHISAGTVDSIVSISSDTYYQAYDYLDQNKRGGTLRLIVAGGWIEGLYLLTNMVESYDAESPIVEEIASQQLTVESVMGFLNDFADEDADVEEIMGELSDIEQLFMNFEYAEGTTESSVNDAGLTVLEGGDRPIISEQQFNELKSLVAELRNSITG
ncbi:MAG: hypothetical protein HOH13_08065 [Crocinitomicaceae bacterium]|nr:hypothetical protein [Crocinitomicaceae bacterium]MBT5402547.1 hypothetical protein [Crocinitomicaceae bacterium]MBT6030246.1 hypothetical protein [Crocinitomicaceae bacterium]MBT6514232.1 hypothetical protein [Crocinitomicaceae bacterium]